MCDPEVLDFDDGPRANPSRALVFSFVRVSHRLSLMVSTGISSNVTKKRIFVRDGALGASSDRAVTLPTRRKNGPRDSICESRHFLSSDTEPDGPLVEDGTSRRRFFPIMDGRGRRRSN